MKKLKLLFMILIGLCGATGCSKAPHSDYVPVENITTNEPTIVIEEEEYKSLNYLIYPENATNKTLTINDIKLNGVVVVTTHTINEIIIYGMKAGTGILSLVSENNRAVSYNITVTPYNPDHLPPEPETTDAVDINNYFNTRLEPYGLETEYIKKESRGGVYLEEGWYLLYKFGVSTDDSLENLRAKLYIFKEFLPSFLFKFNETYRVASEGNDSAQYTLVMVNSNISAVVTIYSFIEDGAPCVEIFIYDYYVNGGLYA